MPRLVNFMGTITRTPIEDLVFNPQLITRRAIGDCDDFALTVLYLTEGKSWLRVAWVLFTFQAVFWLVKSPQNKFWPRHVALWHRRHGWIDSTRREWRSDAGPHRRILPILWPWALLRTIWGATIGRIFTRTV